MGTAGHQRRRARLCISRSISRPLVSSAVASQQQQQQFASPPRRSHRNAFKGIPPLHSYDLTTNNNMAPAWIEKVTRFFGDEAPPMVDGPVPPEFELTSAHDAMPSSPKSVGTASRRSAASSGFSRLFFASLRSDASSDVVSARARDSRRTMMRTQSRERIARGQAYRQGMGNGMGVM